MKEKSLELNSSKQKLLGLIMTVPFSVGLDRCFQTHVCIFLFFFKKRPVPSGHEQCTKAYEQ